MSGGTCILLESDDAVINDITYSLKLIDLEVLVAESLEDAKDLLEEQRPELIIVRGHVVGDSDAGFRLADEVRSHPQFSTVPVMLLCAEGEHDSLDELPESFVAELKLPVEFPTFTKNVRAILQELEESPLEPVAENQQDTSHWRDRNEGGATSLPSVFNPLDKRMMVAYGVQFTVLEQLRNDEEFQQAKLGEIPEILAAVTEQVCRDLDVKKLMG
ncbi:MAG: hypothetical protein KDD55_01860 [Bdellovibrionales bacterium]|nr:hypothetical protein [Bdellovibrionales bacterium]